jgi:dolichol-phosphate mannosyltransferase
LNKGIIIIPTYNEAENIVQLIEDIASLPERFDILVVDDNSPDGTVDKIQQYIRSRAHSSEIDDLKIIIENREDKKGLGTAYIHGFKIALKKGYEYIFEMDADFSHNPLDLILLYNACADEGYDLAIGSRYISGVNVVNWPMGRVLLSYFASSYVRIITRMPVRDATAGFKCYKRKVLETIDLDKIRFIGYAFQIEMKFITWKLGFKLKEVPIVFTDRKRGESKMSVKIIKEAIWGVIFMKFNSFFKKYPTVSQTE